MKRKTREFNRTACSEARIAPETLALVRCVAENQGVRFSREGQEQFASMLLVPPPLSDALVRALARHCTLIA